MKRIGNLYQQICSLENLQLADKIARKGKSKQPGVIEHDRNQEEINRINELIDVGTWPHGWDGTEITGDIMLDKIYCDGSTMHTLFKELQTVNI